jgi:hypothetical protein
MPQMAWCGSGLRLGSFRKIQPQARIRAQYIGAFTDVRRTALLAEQRLEDIGRADRAPMCQWTLDVRHVGIQVVLRAGAGALILRNEPNVRRKTGKE